MLWADEVKNKMYVLICNETPFCGTEYIVQLPLETGNSVPPVAGAQHLNQGKPQFIS
jgi:hypothetical protein